MYAVRHYNVAMQRFHQAARTLSPCQSRSERAKKFISDAKFGWKQTRDIIQINDIVAFEFYNSRFSYPAPVGLVKWTLGCRHMCNVLCLESLFITLTTFPDATH